MFIGSANSDWNMGRVPSLPGYTKSKTDLKQGIRGQTLHDKPQVDKFVLNDRAAQYEPMDSLDLLAGECNF